MAINSTAFWEMTQCSLVSGHQRFGEMYRLEMAEARFYETLVPTYQTTRRHIPEDNNLHRISWLAE
jgi:hypothetical protein